jgi:hypothetical protein
MEMPSIRTRGLVVMRAMKGVTCLWSFDRLAVSGKTRNGADGKYCGHVVGVRQPRIMAGYVSKTPASYPWMPSGCSKHETDAEEPRGNGGACRIRPDVVGIWRRRGCKSGMDGRAEAEADKLPLGDKLYRTCL